MQTPEQIFLRITAFFQSVEDSFLSGDREDLKSIGARVREIVTENLREPDRSLLNQSQEEAMAKSLQVSISK